VSASTSCATIRTRLPARRTLPSRSVATSSAAPISRGLRSPFLKAITELREITLSERIFESWMMTSSVIPSAKYSFSGSGLRFTNGSTAIDGVRAGAATGVTSAAAKAAAEANRLSESRASAVATARSIGTGTEGRTRRTCGSGSVTRRKMIA